MKKLNSTQGMQVACHKLHSILKDSEIESAVIGIAGPVASGKTRFTKELTRRAGIINHRPIIPLPFDLWINPLGLVSKTYEGRFFLDEFKTAVKSAKEKIHFMVPRYDLHRQGLVPNAQSRPTTQTVFWEGRTFDGVDLGKNSNLSGSTGTYLENATLRTYSYFPNDNPSIYIADGTLIAQKDLRQYFDLLIFISAPWVNRVANMVRRFNRNEVFGSTAGAMSEYVEFLIDEARSCADEEIFNQLDQKIIAIEYSPMTLSNYLDLWYLKEFVLNSPNASHWVNPDDVDCAIMQFIEKLHKEYDSATLERLRGELEHLVLAKHLLCLRNKNEILKELSLILK